MLGGVVVFGLQDTQAALTGVAELLRDAPDELVVQPAIRVGAENSQPGCAVMFAYAGPADQRRHFVDAIRQLAVPVHEDHGPMSYQQVQGLNELMPFGACQNFCGRA